MHQLTSSQPFSLASLCANVTESLGTIRRAQDLGLKTELPMVRDGDRDPAGTGGAP